MLVVAHRTPATRAACADIATAGARVFELDVQLDDGGRVVVSHYLPFTAVLQRDNWRLRRRSSGVLDPQVTEVAAIVPDDCLVLLDLKETRPQRRGHLVAALIEQLPDRMRFRVCGGHVADLAQLREAGFPTWRTLRNGRELAGVLTDGSLPDEAVSIRHTVLTHEVVARLHDRVSMVIAWTVNDLSRASRLRRMGVDGVTTDRLEVIREMSSSAN